MFNQSYENYNGNPVLASERRLTIEKDTAEFLAKGGTIDRVAHDVFGDESVQLTVRQKNQRDYREKLERAKKRGSKTANSR